MKREDIIRMAREAGVGWGLGIGGMEDFLERFAALVAAAAKAEENEACAQFLESTQLGSLPDDTALHYARLLKGFAEGIRARKENT
jgi:hypothetical protein